MSASPTFYLRLFGSPSIGPDNGRGVALTGRVAQRHRLALLALIAMAPGQRLSRDKLIAYLWPEGDSERGRNLLKVSSYVLRTELGETALLSEGEDLRLNADVVRADAAELDAALARGDHAAAVALYKGPFLDGFFLSDAPEFEQWAARERERLAARYAKALEALGEKAEAEGDAPRAVEWWKTRAALDPYDSRVALRLMRSFEASGNRAAALQHASIHQRLLEQEFGIAAGSEVTAFAEQLRTKPVVAADISASRASLPEVADHRSPPPVVEVKAQSERRGAKVLSRTGALALAAIVLVVGVLWTIGPGFSQPPERSIAVLPFINLSSDGDDESFNDGLTEEIITGLSAVPELRVISRTSAMHYKGAEKPLPEIARELGVAHILEGSVRRSAGRVRITAQLIDARADEHLWAENYETDLRDVFRVQEQIARQVVRALEVELGERENVALVRHGTKDPEAYRLYQRARYLWNTRTREGHQRAIEYYELAIERDSSYADAWAGLADTYRTAWQLNVSDLSEAESNRVPSGPPSVRSRSTTSPPTRTSRLRLPSRRRKTGAEPSATTFAPSSSIRATRQLAPGTGCCWPGWGGRKRHSKRVGAVTSSIHSPLFRAATTGGNATSFATMTAPLINIGGRSRSVPPLEGPTHGWGWRTQGRVCWTRPSALCRRRSYCIRNARTLWLTSRMFRRCEGKLRRRERRWSGQRSNRSSHSTSGGRTLPYESRIVLSHGWSAAGGNGPTVPCSAIPR